MNILFYLFQWDSEGRIQREVSQEMLDKLKENDPEKLLEMKSLIGKTNNSGNDKGYSDFCIHTAFEGPDGDKDNLNDVPDRESIEMRCFALFE